MCPVHWPQTEARHPDHGVRLGRHLEGDKPLDRQEDQKSRDHDEPPRPARVLLRGLRCRQRGSPSVISRRNERARTDRLPASSHPPQRDATSSACRGNDEQTKVRVTCGHRPRGSLRSSHRFTGARVTSMNARSPDSFDDTFTNNAPLPASSCVNPQRQHPRARRRERLHEPRQIRRVHRLRPLRQETPQQIPHHRTIRPRHRTLRPRPRRPMNIHRITAGSVPAS